MNSINVSKNERLKQTESKIYLENIKSNYIFKRIIEYMKKNKSLEIMKYNKKLQKRLNLNINDYKEYYQSIEIELKISENRYGKFINTSDKEKEYFHIYFNNSKEEIKRNYLKKDEKVRMIKIIIDYQIKSFKRLFYECKCLDSIYFKNFYRNNITNMSSMFYDCLSLK